MRMELFGIIFYIIIFVIFVSAKKAAQSGNASEKSHHRPNPLGNYSHQKSNGEGKSIVEKSEVPVTEKKILPNVPQSGKTIVPNVPMKKKMVRTIMEPHKEEQMQPRIRTNNLWGEDEHAKQRIVALRLMEGDPVPGGYVRIRCPYCGADNLVTKQCKEYHSCYFCRVPID